ncbi:glutamate receptor ionotropic, delta-2-like [Schistocerca gregaria]|uniref:glutamate receptor ionotropic, delta-2-like n=1 Tax=Schistocerca gregaria TaxID=7010 RepID=UPI00211EE824|nr:glutamate receptor ionotropic, delta-2-like [Schistocerca gregaria]
MSDSASRTRRLRLSETSPPAADSVRVARRVLGQQQGVWLLQAPPLSAIPRCSSSLILLHYDCPQNRRIFQQSASAGLLGISARWLVVSASQPEEGLPLRMDSEVTWVTSDAGGMLRQVSVYRPHPALPLHSLPASVLQDLRLRGGRNPRWDLEGHVLHAAATVVNTPLDHLGDRLRNVKDKHLDTITRYGWSVCTTLSHMYNFRLVLMATPSFGFTTDGVVGLLHNGSADLGVPALIMSAKRLGYVDFTGPSRLWTSKIMFRHPKIVGIYGALFKPFRASLWACCGLTFLLVLLAARLVNWVHSDGSWSCAMLFVFSAITLQKLASQWQRRVCAGAAVPARWASWRLLLLCSVLSALLLDTHYSAAIVTSLLLPPPRTINTKVDLVHSPLAFGLENLSNVQEYFEKSEDPVDRALFATKVFPPGAKQPNYFPLEVGVHKMATEPFAFHTEEVNMYPLIERIFSPEDKCSLVVTPLLPPVMTYTPVQKKSPLKEMVTVGLRKLWETGHVAYWRTKWHSRRPSCLVDGQFASARLDTLAPAFLLLIAALLVAPLLLLCEVLSTRRSTVKDAYTKNAKWANQGRTTGTQEK